jgi:hypothetical protein
MSLGVYILLHQYLQLDHQHSDHYISLKTYIRLFLAHQHNRRSWLNHVNPEKPQRLPPALLQPCRGRFEVHRQEAERQSPIQNPPARNVRCFRNEDITVFGSGLILSTKSSSVLNGKEVTLQQ